MVFSLLNHHGITNSHLSGGVTNQTGVPMIATNVAESGATALLAVVLIVVFAIAAFGATLLVMRQRKRGMEPSENDNDIEYSRLMSKSARSEE